MSMSMYCVAVRPADEDYKRKLEAYRACEVAGIPIPKELRKFFNDEEPDPEGIAQVIGNGCEKQPHPSCDKYKAEYSEGFQVDISKLPEGTRFIRFYCSY